MPPTEAAVDRPAYPRPRIVVSRCLGFDHCRYDGSIIADRIVAALGQFVDWVLVCPEAEIGLGIPRPPVRLVQGPEGVRLVQPQTERDFTEAMQAFAAGFLDALPPVDGFILKNRSPSCGFKDTKVYAGPGKAPSLGTGPGMFAQAVLERFPDLPVEDEGRLTNRNIREHFLTAIFALAALREVEQSGRMGDLVRFHARHKFLLLALSQARLRELGRVVANPESLPFARVLERYRLGFRTAVARPPRRPAVVNVLLHALGYFSDRLLPAEKAYFLDLLVAYREGQQPLSAPVSVLRAWIVRFAEPYLADQTFLSPYPQLLVSAMDSGKGKE